MDTKQTQHTPGPWIVTDQSLSHQAYSSWHIKAGNITLAVLTGQKNRIGDGAMMKAAPDLSDALQTLLDAAEGNHVTAGDCNQARAALAKARGGA